MSAARVAALQGGRRIRWVASHKPSAGPVGTFWRMRYVFGAAAIQIRPNTVTRFEAECETEAEAIERARRLVDSHAACIAFVLDTRTGRLRNWSARYDDAAKAFEKGAPSWPDQFSLHGVPVRPLVKVSGTEEAGA